MILELAPLEGITTYVYRNAYARHFGGVDKYYTPFLSLHKEKEFNHKERQEILPENNTGIQVVPQVLTHSAEDFLKAAQRLKELGYEEINLNCGCPSGTVTAKNKGAGMLADPMALDRFLGEIFEKTPMKISIKTRIGMEYAWEWEDLLKIYNKYPIHELIIHPRVRADFYKNTPNQEAFALAMRESRCPVCYNGDIFRREDFERLKEAFPDLERVMLGRGILAGPDLAEQLQGAMPSERSGGYYQRLRAFHDEIYEGYRELLSGDRNIMFKLKELWHYMVYSFPDAQKHEKKLRKINSCTEYEAYINWMFQQVR